MKKIIFIGSILFVLAGHASAVTLYTCTDLHGHPVITTNPQDGMTDCVPKDFSGDVTSPGKEDFQTQGFQSNAVAETSRTPDGSVNQSTAPRNAQRDETAKRDQESPAGSCRGGNCLAPPSTQPGSESYATPSPAPVDRSSSSVAGTTNKKSRRGYRPPPSDTHNQYPTPSSSTAN